MEFNLSKSRIILLVVLLAGFALLGGFTPPTIPDSLMLDPRRVTKAWFYCVLVFGAGAGCVSIVDHFVGTMERSNLRLLYVILGVILMTGSGMYIYTLKNVSPGGRDLEEQAHASLLRIRGV